MIPPSPHVSPGLARALAARLRDTVEASDRLARFVFDGDAEQERVSSALGDGDELATAHDFVLRALHAASDRTNHQIVAAAAAAVGEGARIDRLAAEAGLTRLALLERVNDLIQLGLVARDLAADTVRATPAGEGLVELVAELDIEVAEWLRRRRRT